MAGERRTPYSQGPLHFFSLLLAFGSAAGALVHRSAVVLDSQEHGTLHYPPASGAAAVCSWRGAAVFIGLRGWWRGHTTPGPPPEGAYWAAADGPGGGSAAALQRPRSPQKGLEARPLLTSAAPACGALGRNVAAGLGGVRLAETIGFEQSPATLAEAWRPGGGVGPLQSCHACLG